MSTMYVSVFDQDIYMRWLLLMFEKLISPHVLQLEILKAKTKVLTPEVVICRAPMRVTVTDVTSVT